MITTDKNTTNNQDALLKHVYNTVKAHLLRQNAKCTRQNDKGEPCGALWNGDLRCAVGCLIDVEWEKMISPFNTIVAPPEASGKDRFLASQTRFAVASSIATDISGFDTWDQVWALLADLQHVHDQVLVPDWKEKLDEVGIKHGLIKEAA